MLDFVKETFDQMPLLAQMAVIFSLFFAFLARRDYRFCFFVCNQDQELLRIIRAIRDHALKISKQAFRLGNIVTLSAGQQKAQRVAQSIYAGMDLRAESAPAASECLVFLPTVFFDAPAAQGCARKMVLSSKICSISGSLAKC